VDVRTNSSGRVLASGHLYIGEAEKRVTNLRLEKLPAFVSTEWFSHHQGESIGERARPFNLTCIKRDIPSSGMAGTSQGPSKGHCMKSTTTVCTQGT